MKAVYQAQENDPLTPATRLLDGQVHKLVKNSAVIHTSHGSHMASRVSANPGVGLFRITRVSSEFP